MKGALYIRHVREVLCLFKVVPENPVLIDGGEGFP